MLLGDLGSNVKTEIIETYPTYKVATPSKKFFSRKNRQNHADSMFQKVMLVRLSLK